jgi:hypothetical protein
MGYEVHITRKTNLFDEGPEISLEEWEAYADSDPLLSVHGWVTWRIDGNSVRAKIFVVREAGNPDTAALCWYRGDISAKNPSPAGIVHMVSIADRLNAKVQGDDGEFFDAQGNPVSDQLGS